MNYVFEVKYSVFGEFESLESTPELIGKLNNIYTNYSMLPNTITMQEFTNQGVVTKYRPQLIKTTKNITINFLPDRIDVQYLDNDNSIIIEDFSILSSRMMDDLSNLLDLEINRISCNIRGVLLEKSKCKLINKETYFKDEDFVEWNVRSVHRKTIEFSDRKEMINIVIEQFLPESDLFVNINNKVKNYKGIAYVIDINTVMPNTTGLYKMKDVRQFNRAILSEINDVNKTIEDNNNE